MRAIQTEIELEKIKLQKIQSDRIKELDKTKAYELLQRLQTQYSSNEVISISARKSIG